MLYTYLLIKHRRYNEFHETAPGLHLTSISVSVGNNFVCSDQGKYGYIYEVTFYIMTVILIISDEHSIKQTYRADMMARN